MCLLNIFIDQDSPTRVLNAFIDGWVSSGSNNPVIFDWLSESINKMVMKKENFCKFQEIYTTAMKYNLI